jgi:menaquinone-dependent protoporphyrinogen oxidase
MRKARRAHELPSRIPHAHDLPALAGSSAHPNRTTRAPSQRVTRSALVPRLHHPNAVKAMANVLIVYATKEGQTGRIATRMAETFRAEGHDVELVNTEQTPVRGALDRFRLVLVGAPIHAQGYPRSIVRFVRDHRALLERLPSAFFSVGLAVCSRTSDGRAQTLELVERFVQKTGWRPRRIELIAGALPYTKYDFVTRFVMRRIVAKEGGDTDTSRDYEYTDWPRVAAFAQELAHEIATPAPHAVPPLPKAV